MQLSIVIVNYNVKFFLEQCLHSVIKAIKKIDSEIFVVDNNSVDGSCAMVKEKFPNVNLIQNKTNYGFSKANNQAIKHATGEYILLLNPDTIVEENTFQLTISFMNENKKAGALSVKMIDGTGNFLPESKRALPTPMVAFYKIFGLSSIFPKSKIFGKYHLSYLDKNEINEVEILPGAFMFIRKEALDKAGLLDESFFMYGEDIDLSYRIIKAGYTNYYFPKTTIIHYKGESTKKSSVNYVKVFYNAMIIFAHKHFSKQNAFLFSFIINLAIYFRATVAILHRFIKAAFLPLLDIGIIYSGIYFFEPFWARIKFGLNVYYPKAFLAIIVPIYIFIWLTSVYYSGGYDKPLKISKHLKGIAIGTLIILVIYSLLPENLRFSRFLLLMGALYAIISTTLIRLFLAIFQFSWLQIDLNRRKIIAIVGNDKECERIKSIINKTEISSDIAGFIGIDETEKSIKYLGYTNQLNEIISINKIDELIFSGSDLSSQLIIEYMLTLSNRNIEFKIAPPESLSIIGSNSIHSAGDLYLMELNSISKIENKRNKRLFDFSISILFLIFFPVLCFFYKKPFHFLKNILFILFSKFSWIGYHPDINFFEHDLPSIKKGILNPADKFKNQNMNQELIRKVNFVYAKDYKILNDFEILYFGFRKLDRKF